MKILLLLLSLSAFAQDIIPITQVGDPILRKRALDVDMASIADPEFQGLLDAMAKTMKKASGVGIAGPQVNQPLRVFLMKDSLSFIPLTIMINPVLTPVVEAGQVDSVEGCLSIPGPSVRVKRWKKLHLSYYNRKGEHVSEEVKGRKAIISQHEYDHINGKLIIDHKHGSNR